MSDVFSKLGDSLKSTLKVATEQTQKSVDQVACRTDLLNKRNELKRLFTLLGEAQYKCHVEQIESEDRDELYAKIDALKLQITEVEKRLGEIVTTQKSSLDSYKREVKSTWNEPETKEKKADLDEDGIEILKVCPVCNTGNHEHAAYCIKCGNKFE